MQEPKYPIGAGIIGIALENSASPGSTHGMEPTCPGGEESVRLATLFRVRFTDLLERTGYNPASLARELGCTAVTVRKWTKKSEPGAFLLRRAAKILRCPVGWLLGEDIIEYLPKGMAIVDQSKIDLMEEAERTGDWSKMDAHLRDLAALGEHFTPIVAYREPRLVTSTERWALDRKVRDLMARYERWLGRKEGAGEA